jgi:deoxyribonuclease-1-like protein
MRIFLFLITWGAIALSLGQSCKVLTWNIQHLGGSKDAQEIAAMVDILRDYDLVLIQEVVAKDPAGAQRVAMLADELDRTGTNWDYRVSDPTNSPSPYIRERYAMLWKASRLRLHRAPRLDSELAQRCDREPYLAGFFMKGSPRPFFVVNFHARPHNKKPEQEIQNLLPYPTRLATNCVLIAGDFNLDETHFVWEPLKRQGFRAALQQTPTTLKRNCDEGNYFNHPIDNIYYPTQCFSLLGAGRVDFVKDCAHLQAARAISDHVPVWIEIEWRGEE